MIKNAKKKVSIKTLTKGQEFFKNENDKSTYELLFIDGNMIAYNHKRYGNKIGNLVDFEEVFVEETNFWEDAKNACGTWDELADYIGIKRKTLFLWRDAGMNFFKEPLLNKFGYEIKKRSRKK